MKAKIIIGFAALTLLAWSPSRLAAQNETPAPQKPKTLTGCLQRGEAVTAYKLVNKDGVWELGGTKKLKLGPQVDRTVRVSGKIAETFDEKAPKKPGQDPNIRGIFAVTKITEVNATCNASQF